MALLSVNKPTISIKPFISRRRLVLPPASVTGHVAVCRESIITNDDHSACDNDHTVVVKTTDFYLTLELSSQRERLRGRGCNPLDFFIAVNFYQLCYWHIVGKDVEIGIQNRGGHLDNLVPTSTVIGFQVSELPPDSIVGTAMCAESVISRKILEKNDNVNKRKQGIGEIK